MCNLRQFVLVGRDSILSSVMYTSVLAARGIAMLGTFAPYTSLGTSVVWAPKDHALSAFAFQSNGDATSSGFDNFGGEYTYGGQYQFSPTIGGNLHVREPDHGLEEESQLTLHHQPKMYLHWFGKRMFLMAPAQV